MKDIKIVNISNANYFMYHQIYIHFMKIIHFKTEVNKKFL